MRILKQKIYIYIYKYINMKDIKKWRKETSLLSIIYCLLLFAPVHKFTRKYIKRLLWTKKFVCAKKIIFPTSLVL